MLRKHTACSATLDSHRVRWSSFQFTVLTTGDLSGDVREHIANVSNWSMTMFPCNHCQDHRR